MQIVRTNCQAKIKVPDSAAGKYAFPAARGEQEGCGEVTLYKISADYETKVLAAARQQLAKAGIRLAQALRDSFK